MSGVVFISGVTSRSLKRYFVFPLPPLLEPDEDALPELAAPELLAFDPPEELALPELAPLELELALVELAPPELALPELPALELAPPELALPELPALELAPPELALPELWPLELAPLELLEAEPPLDAELFEPLEPPVLLDAELRSRFEDAFILVPIAPESVTVASAIPPENNASRSAYSDALAAVTSRRNLDRAPSLSTFIAAV